MTLDRQVKAGSVHYSNAAPLIEGLSESGINLLLATPDRLKEKLDRGEVDIALAPIAASFSPSRARIVSGLGVASTGPIRSVLLFHRVPADRVRIVALDSESVTSRLLARVVLERFIEQQPRYIEYPRGTPLSTFLEGGDADAFLAIGDKALAFEKRCPHVDLAEAWHKHTGLPFVFAAWLAREGYSPPRDIIDALHAAAERGVAAIPQIAARESVNTGIDAAELQSYLEGIEYFTDKNHLDGIELFRQLTGELEPLPKNHGGPDTEHETR